MVARTSWEAHVRLGVLQVSSGSPGLIKLFLIR